MKKILFVIPILAILLVGTMFFINQYKHNEDYEYSDELGMIILKPEEATSENIISIRNSGYDGLIYVPETMSLYGKTSNLDKEDEQILKIVNGWVK